jgi:hypothetical protein
MLDHPRCAFNSWADRLAGVAYMHPFGKPAHFLGRLVRRILLEIKEESAGADEETSRLVVLETTRLRSIIWDQ